MQIIALIALRCAQEKLNTTLLAFRNSLNFQIFAFPCRNSVEVLFSVQLLLWVIFKYRFSTDLENLVRFVFGTCTPFVKEIFNFSVVGRFM